MFARRTPARRRAGRPPLYAETLEGRVLPSTVTWINPAGGDWDTAANWQDDKGVNRLPGPNDDAVINVAGNVTITHSQNVTDTIKSLTAGDPLTLSGGTLSVSGNLSNSSPITLSGGTLTNATVLSGTLLTATGNSTLDGVTLGGDLEINAGIVVTAVNGLTLQDGKVGLNSPNYLYHTALVLSGTGAQTLAGTGQVVFGSGAYGPDNQLVASGQALTIAPGITVTTSTGGGTVGDPSQPLTIQGTISSQAGGQFLAIHVTGTAVTNTGSLQAAGGSLEVTNLQNQNTGSVSATSGGTLTLDGTWQNNGTISETNATVNLASTFTLAELGTFQRSGGAVNMVGTLDNTGTTLALDNATGSWNLAGTIKHGIVTTAGQAQVVATGNSTLDGVTLGGDLEINAGIVVTAVNGLTLQDGKVGLNSPNYLYHTALVLSGTGAQTLAGAGQVVFGGGAYGPDNQLVAPGQALTIAAGITLTTGSSGGGTAGDPSEPLTIQGTVQAGGSGIRLTGTSVSNTGALQANAGGLEITNLQNSAGATVSATTGGTLTLDGTWQNSGSISETNATVNLASTFTLAQLGAFTRSGGTVNLTGTLDNTGTTLALDDATGSWNLAGTIRNGTVTTAGQAQLVAAGNSTLDGVTLGGDLEVNPGVVVTAVNGLTLQGGKVGLNSINYLYHTALVLSGTGAQALAGTGQVVFGGGTSGPDNQLVAPGQALTIAAGITLTTGSSGGGTVGDPAEPLTIHGTVQAGGSGIRVTGTSITNTGLLEAVAGGLSLAGPLTNTGTIQAIRGGNVTLQGATTIDQSGFIGGQPGATITAQGNLVGATGNAQDCNPQATVTLAGTGTATAPQLLEAMSNDLGNVPAGFFQNFAYGKLALDNNTYVQLVDQARNSKGTGPEAVYAASLLVPAGTTLDFNGLHVYARAAQISGTVLNGSVSLVPAGGPVQFASLTPGDLAASGQVDDWTFFGRAGQTVRVVVSSGGGSQFPPLSPPLNYAQVQLVDPSGNVVATGSNSASGGDASIAGAALTADGTYHLRVQAAPAQPTSTGNYVLMLWDATAHTAPLNVNQNTAGRLASPYAVDNWTFTVAANQQIRFNLINTAMPGILFDLTGPNGYTGFSGASTSSDLINLPSAGTYTLTVHATPPSQGAYAFRLDQTSVTALFSGMAFNGIFSGSGQAQLFTIATPQDKQLLITLRDNNRDQVEAYAKFGAPPTRADYQYMSAVPTSVTQTILVPAASPGTWYILVYAGAVAAAPQSYTLTATVSPLSLTAVTPDHLGNAADAILTLTGAGFDSTTTVSLVAAGGTTYRANQTQLDLPTQLSATFTAGSVPAGVYSVVVTRADGLSASLPGAFTMDQGGLFHFEAHLDTPAALGYHVASTLYLHYINTGDLAMPAPILEVTVSQTHADGTTDQKALLTLDPSIATQGLWTSTVPAGFSNKIDILASGATPGLLQPGESIVVPIYWAGWQQPWDIPAYPNFDPEISLEDVTDTTPIDWASIQQQFQPPGVSTAAWNAVFPNLEAQIGNTWGGFVQRLDNDAAYLGHLGEKVTDLSQLWQFEIQQAYGFSPVQTLSSAEDAAVPTPGPALMVDRALPNSLAARYAMGPFGLGWQWTAGWQRVLSVADDGTITISNPDSDADGAPRIFTPDSRGGYFPEPGDTGTLTAVSGGFLLREDDGESTMFGSNGLISYVQDIHGNRVDALYTNGLLASLTAATGQGLTFTYNSAGLITSVTDSTGRATSYAYDPSNQYLLSVTDFAGRTTTYTYDTSGPPATRNALLAVQHPDGTVEHFTYDSEGRLTQQYVDNGTSGSPTSSLVTYAYGPDGEVDAADADQGTTKYFADARGLFVKIEDPLGNVIHATYDDRFNKTQTIDPAGRSTNFAYDQNGNLVRITGAIGDITSATYSGPLDKMASFTDPNGHTTSYAYDGQGDLLSITYPDGTQHQFNYDPLGNLVESINARGQVVQNTYNGMGQLTRTTFADGTFYAYAYDAHGNLVSAGDGTNTTTFQYDPVTEDLVQVNYPSGRFLKFTYDSAGRRTQSVDQNGFTVNYRYTLGLLAGLSDGNGNPIVTYTYDAAGRLIQKDMGNGTSTTYQYDRDGKILSLVNHVPGGSVNSRFDYTYDSLGNVTSMTTLDGAWTYQYDPAGHLTHAVFSSNNPGEVPNQDLQYVYDLAGNRVESIVNGVTTTYAVNDMNQATQVGSATLHYDADGNLVAQTDSSGTTTYTYDPLNRLTGVSSPTTGSAAYQYDPLGNLASITQNGQTTNYVIDPILFGNVVGEYDSTGGLIANYTYGLGLTSRLASGQAAYYDFDRAGSTVGISGAAGTYQNLYRYLPFGETLTATGMVPNPFQFVGQFGVMRQASGLDFMRARFYSSTQGRFLSPDPLGLGGGQSNLYAYASQNPLRLIDPTGESDKDCLTKQERDQLADLYFKTEKDMEDLGKRIAELYAQIQLLQPQLDLADPKQRAKLQADINFIKLLIDVDEKKWQYDQSLERATLKELAKPDCPKPPPPKPPKPPKPKKCPYTVLELDPGTETLDCPPPPTSHDPNAKSGPAGYGPQGFIRADAVLPYRISFENDPTATAPAQRVVITDPLDPNIDRSTLQFTEVGFGDNIIPIPAGSQHFQTTLSMTYNGHTFDVQIELGFNAATGLVTATFQSIDPGTGLPPDILTGVLPPEDGTGRGKGYISYTAMPKAGLPTGAQIHNVATVTFDVNPPITTDQVDENDPSKGVDPAKQDLNTIDAVAPTSSLSSLPAFSPASFTVSWAGQDDPGGSGLASFDVYVSDNGGDFTLWQSDTTATSATFTGAAGHTYAFYSSAFDNAGNAQAPPTGAQVTTKVDAVAPASTVAPLPAASPASFTVSWSGSDNSGGSGVAFFDVYVSDNGGPFVALLTGTTQTSTTFTGQDGHTYGFYSVATDNAGNVQPAPAAAQATTTVDTTPPSSSVTAPFGSMTGNFTVTWAGSDATSGIASYSVYASVDGGPFTLWQDHVKATRAVWHGALGHRYAFYSVATDNVGNVQPTPVGAQATTAVVHASAVLRRNGADVELLDTVTNRVVNARAVSDPAPLIIQGNDTQADTLTVNYASGGEFALSGGIRFDAGAGKGDRFFLVGAGSTATLTPGAAAGSETMLVAGTAIALTGIEAQQLTGLQALAITTSGGNDALRIDTPARRRSRLRGSSGGAALAPLTFFAVQGLAIDLGAGDGASAVNSLTVTGPWAASGLKNVSVTGGAGSDTLTLSTTSLRLPVLGGTYQFSGGGGTDTVVASGNTSWTLTDAALSSSLGGRLALSGVTQARLFGGAGNNALNASGFSGRVLLSGGAGNDVLRAGAGGGVLLGGTGNDALIGGAGRSVLIGGVGQDALWAGSGGDILIAGYTAFDNNAAALLALLAEWQRTDETYSQRLDHLRHGGGLNGTTTLTRATVHDDLFIDTLTGGAGTDWFWLKLPPGVVDRLRNREPGEAVN
jgi:RHS repeat-associated protein